MSDDGYDSMDAERDREERLRREMKLQGPFDDFPDPVCLDDDEPVAEQHDHEILVSGESHTPVGLICSCGKRYRVVPE